jgi:hypothetical protein
MGIGLPQGIRVEQDGATMEIVRRWFGWATVALTAFIVLWDAFLVFWYTIALSLGAPAIMIWFPALHVAVGLGMTYTAVAGWVNRTVIRVGTGVVSVRHGPLPWFGNADLDSVDIKQLYCKEKVTRSRSGTSLTYEVRVITRDDRNVRLVGGLPGSEQAIYLEQAIEKYLGIVDQPVKGELSSPE